MSWCLHHIGPYFRQRAVELAQAGDRPVWDVARGLGTSEFCLHNWLWAAGIADGHREGLTSAEKKGLTALRRDKRRLETENEILRQAAV